jgi:hypothetical protein
MEERVDMSMRDSGDGLRSTLLASAYLFLKISKYAILHLG